MLESFNGIIVLMLLSSAESYERERGEREGIRIREREKEREREYVCVEIVYDYFQHTSTSIFVPNCLSYCFKINEETNFMLPVLRASSYV